VRTASSTGSPNASRPAVANQRGKDVAFAQRQPHRNAQRLLAASEKDAAMDFAHAIEAREFLVQDARQQHQAIRLHVWPRLEMKKPRQPNPGRAECEPWRKGALANESSLATRRCLVLSQGCPRAGNPRRGGTAISRSALAGSGAERGFVDAKRGPPLPGPLPQRRRGSPVELVGVAARRALMAAEPKIRLASRQGWC
jgi:hypothetical protein